MSKNEEKEMKKDGEEYDGDKNKEPNLEGEWGNIAILTLLYILQGVPMGLAAAVPLMLKEKNVSYQELGTFSLTSWPFSLKLLWAPFVDSLYIAKYGRRKTWLIPTQLLIGLLMCAISFSLENWMGEGGHAVEIVPLTASFFALYFLCATQDVAVDGWALTMLRPENVGYGSTCNSAGQIAGYFLTFTGTLAMQHFQIMSLAQFMNFCGICFIVVTVAVAILKKEGDATTPDDPIVPPHEVFKLLAGCVQVPAVREVVGFLLVWKIPFAANDALVGLRAQEAGFSKEILASISVVVTPIQIVIPLLLGQITAGARPLDVCKKLYPYRMLMGIFAFLIILSMPESLKDHSTITAVHYFFYFMVFVLTVVSSIISTAFFSAQMSFFAKISEKDIGGTYMTMLNTFSNLGGMWTLSATLFMADHVAVKDADGKEIVSSYFILVSVCSAIGLVGLKFISNLMNKLQNYKPEQWSIKKVDN